MAREKQPPGQQPSMAGTFPCNGADIGACRRRTAAMRAREFVYDWDHKGWTFITGDLRAMSPQARYFALVERGEQFPHTDHTGEPYLFESCPFCGGLLPDLATLMDEDRNSLTLPPPEEHPDAD